MISGNEGSLTLTVGMRVSPEPEVIDLLERYRDALNYSIRKIIGHKATSLSKVHELLYNDLKERFRLPPRIVVDCYREALAVAKSWIRNKNRGDIPSVKTLRMCLTPIQGYRVKEGCVELGSRYKLRIIGWDRRYDQYPNREARLVYKDGKMILMITKKVPRPTKYDPKGILAVDVNERYIVVGNTTLERRFETVVDDAYHFRKVAENLQVKYSSVRYRGWYRRGVLERIRNLHRKSAHVVEDWAKKTAHEIVGLAKQHNYAIAREDLTYLIEALRKLSKEHKIKTISLSYRRLLYWVNWEAEKHGVPVIVVNPRGTSSTCPKCGSRLRENGYRKLKCRNCEFEGDRDTVAVLNIEMRAHSQMGGSLATPTAPQMKDVNPNRCGEPMKPLKGALQGRRRSVDVQEGHSYSGGCP
ncbi:MAG: RNA-guided endonuclease TnpB family protein [Candidatus Methanodesulfokora washburnensis]|jgi:putative transposase